MIVNQYKFCSPSKALARELIYFSRFSYLFVKNGFKNKTILFYPDYPYRKAEILKIISLTDFNVTNNPNLKFDIVFHWEDITVRKSDPFLEKISKKYKVINHRCLDISKAKVENVFGEVFGYNSHVDPLTHKGKCVRKSNDNCKHDFSIIDCPISTLEEGYVYQKLFNNACEDNPDLTEEFRFTIVKDTITAVTIRQKSINDRFNNTVKKRLIEPASMFTQQELKKVLEFCQAIGLEYGELDIIRDKDDNRIYILDANNTPTVSPVSVALDMQEQQVIWGRTAKAFMAHFLDQKVAPTGSAIPTKEKVAEKVSVR